MIKNIVIIIFLLIQTWNVYSQPKNIYRRQVNQTLKFAEYLVKISPDSESVKTDFILAKQLHNRANIQVNRGKRFAAEKNEEKSLQLLEDIIRQLSPGVIQLHHQECEQMLNEAQKCLGDTTTHSIAAQYYDNAKINFFAAIKDKIDPQQAINNFRLCQLYAQKSLDMCRNQNYSTEEKLLLEKKRFQNLKNHAETLIGECQSTRANELLVQAGQREQLIDKALNEKDYTKALDLYYETTRLLFRAIDTCKNQKDDFILAKEKIELLTNTIKTVDGSQQHTPQKTKKAKLFLKNSKMALKKKNYRAAIRNAEMGQDILGPTQMPHSRLSKPSTFDREILKLERQSKILKQRQFKNIKNKNDFINAINFCLKNSRNFAVNNHYDIAYEFIQIGNKIIQHGNHHSRTAIVPTIQTTGNKIEILDQKIKDGMISNPVHVTQAAQLLLQSAKKFHSEQNYLLASEFAIAGCNMLDTLVE